LTGLGAIFFFQNDHNRALSYLKQALNIYEKIGATNTPNSKTARELIQTINTQIK